MQAPISSTATAKMCFAEIHDFFCLCCDLYETTRRYAVASLPSSLSPQQKNVINRITQCVPEIFVALCALSGHCLVLATCVWIVCRSVVPFNLFIEGLRTGNMHASFFRGGGFAMIEYPRMFEEKIGPALLVAFAVDSLFCVVVGVATLSFYHICKALMVSMPAAYLMYEQQKRSCGG